jgi:hemerythrin
LPWTPNLAIGVDIIDNQHKMLFEKAEKLFEAGRNKNSKEYISELLDFLDDYTKKHFADEEKYMLSINYPGYAEQKQAHTAFIGKIAKLREEYNKSGGSLVVIINANKMVLDWITQHISVMDKKIVDYAKSRKI